MPFDNLPYSNLVEKYGFVPLNHSHTQLFPSEVRRVFDERGEELDGYRRIVREDTGKTLQVVTDGYTLIDNKVVFAAFEDAIAKSGLDSTGLIVATDYANEGNKVFRQYVWPAHQIEVQPGVTTALRAVMWNSYDKTTAFCGRSGAYTWVCANTSMMGKDIGDFRIRHAGDIDVAGAIKGLIGAAEQHVVFGARMKAWPQMRITDAHAQELIRAIPKISDAQTDRLVHSWLVARDADTVQSGSNLWTAYAVLTAWSTHGDDTLGAFPTESIDRSRTRVRYERERQVAQVIDGVLWKELEAA